MKIISQDKVNEALIKLEARCERSAENGDLDMQTLVNEIYNIKDWLEDCYEGTNIKKNVSPQKIYTNSIGFVLCLDKDGEIIELNPMLIKHIKGEDVYTSIRLYDSSASDFLTLKLYKNL
jgi:hypothetical protein